MNFKKNLMGIFFLFAMVGKMLKSVKIIKNIRKVFKAGETIPLRPLTFLVGDNGSGKTTFLESLSSRFVNGESGEIEISKEELRDFKGYSHFDLEKHNPRRQDQHSITFFGCVSAFRSHGETNMDMFVHDFAEKKNEIILLDEPDQALSIRSIYRLFKIFEKMIANGCQIIAAVHSQTLMELVDEIYSIEHRKWMTCSEFLKTQKRPKKLKTVDSFKKNKRYQVKFTTNEGFLYYTDRRELYRMRISDLSSSSRNAKCFKGKKSAESAAKRAIDFFTKSREKLSGVEKMITPEIIGYEIEQMEFLFDQD